MKKLLIVIASTLLLSGCTAQGLFVKKPAGLEISTTPASTVFLNGENVGETPYSNKAVTPGEYTIKLVPVSGENVTPYEIKRKLASEVSTVISRTFAASEPDSSGYILMFEPVAGDKTFISVISDPDAVNVNIDDQPHGFTPVSKLETSPGAHSVFLASPGYLEQTIGINTVKGYNLVVSAKLASQGITLAAPPSTLESTPSASLSPVLSPSPSPSGLAMTVTMAKPYVVVNDTADTQASSGLNVRKEASSTSDPIGKASIGEQLKYLGETTPAGWHKVEFESSVGYVSGKYVNLVK
jgi:uncharacterized protein YgiM (DUF1202 family)